MFCDLVGSTALSARFDPEDLSAAIGAYHRRVVAVIEAAGGFVAKYMGDGVLAYFGYPRADEHDAERAVQAGLAVVEAVAGLDTAAGAPHHPARAGGGLPARGLRRAAARPAGSGARTGDRRSAGPARGMSAVRNWLEAIGLGQYADAFVSQ
jgi:hypothetical protein